MSRVRLVMFRLLDHDDEVFDPPQGTTVSLELHKAVICMLAYQCGRNTNGYDAAAPALEELSGDYLPIKNRKKNPISPLVTSCFIHARSGSIK